jgi:hypothetical protein
MSIMKVFGAGSSWLIFMVLLLDVASRAWGQTPATQPIIPEATPFFSAAPSGYEAEPSSIAAGTAPSYRVNVSPDLKYVTIGTQSTQANLQALQTFNFAGPSSLPGGVVGINNAPTAAGAGGVQTQIGGAGSVLTKPGMTLIVPLP